MPKKASVAIQRARQLWESGKARTLPEAARLAGAKVNSVRSARYRERWQRKPSGEEQPAEQPEAQRKAIATQARKIGESAAVLLLQRVHRAICDESTTPRQLAQLARVLAVMRGAPPREEIPPDERYRRAKAEREEAAVAAARGNLVEIERVRAAHAANEQAWRRAVTLAEKVSQELADELERVALDLERRIVAEIPALGD